jgi:aryl-alcohol dehydrogenase-like predicted oxidoreductase
MLYRMLGKTGLSVSEIGFGCASFWGKKIFSEPDAIRLVHAAVDHGVTFFDTGSSYSGGNAEPRLGRALSEIKNRRELVIATKAGSRNAGNRVYYDHSPSWIRQSVEDSLIRLKLDAIPLLHLHGPQPANLTDDLLDTLARLREQGKVLHFGTNNGNIQTIERVLEIPLFETVMTNYSILQPERGTIMDKIASRGFGVLAGMAVGGGLFQKSGFHFRGLRDAWYALRAWKNHRPEIRRAKHLQFLRQQDEWAGGEIAIAWVLRNPGVGSAVFSTTRIEHLLGNLRASGRTLGDEVLHKIDLAQSRWSS